MEKQSHLAVLIILVAISALLAMTNVFICSIFSLESVLFCLWAAVATSSGFVSQVNRRHVYQTKRVSLKPLVLRQHLRTCAFWPNVANAGVIIAQTAAEATSVGKRPVVEDFQYILVLHYGTHQTQSSSQRRPR